MSFDIDEHEKQLKKYQRELKKIKRDTYYYRENNKIWFSSEGDGIFVAEIRANANYSAEETIDSMVVALNEMQR